MAQVAEITYGQKVMEKETEKRISEIEGEREIPACLFLKPRSVAGVGGASFPLLCNLCAQMLWFLWNIPCSLCSDLSFGEIRSRLALIFHFREFQSFIRF